MHKRTEPPVYTSSIGKHEHGRRCRYPALSRRRKRGHATTQGVTSSAPFPCAYHIYVHCLCGSHFQAALWQARMQERLAARTELEGQAALDAFSSPPVLSPASIPPRLTAGSLRLGRVRPPLQGKAVRGHQLEAISRARDKRLLPLERSLVCSRHACFRCMGRARRSLVPSAER